APSVAKPEAPSVAKPEAPSVEEALAAGRLILVAEDHPTNRQVLLRQLAMLGCAAEVAEDGREALERWRSGRYALVLTDCQMPEMDGFDLTRAIRAAEAGTGARVPVVAITANAMEGEAQKCLAVGMDDAVSKPTEIDQLRRILERWLPPPAGEAAPPLDLAALGSLFDGDEAFIRELLAEFMASNRTTLARLEAAFAERAWDEVRQAGHKLAGSSRTVGALDLAAVGDAIETSILDGRTDGIEEMVPRAARELARVAAFVARV
ncbi:MAG TPA: response regulator, partial [Azospirillum sp.]